MRGPDGAAALRKRETVMNNKLSTKGTWLTRLGNLIAGTQKHFPTGQLTIGGTAYDVATLVSTLQSLESAITSSDAAKAKWNDALKNEQATNANVAPLVRDYAMSDTTRDAGDAALTRSVPRTRLYEPQRNQARRGRIGAEPRDGVVGEGREVPDEGPRRAASTRAGASGRRLQSASTRAARRVWGY